MIENRLVLYLDILGVKKLSEPFVSGDFVEAEKKVVEIENILKTFLEDTKRTEDLGTQIKIFTDNIVISEQCDLADRLSCDNIHDLFLKVMITQFDLATQGIFLRGGISIGSYYYSDITLLGNALMQSYKIESGIAKTARIVAGESFWENLEQLKKACGETKVLDISTLFLKDGDEFFFLDYLGFVSKVLDATADEILSNHKEGVIKSICESADDIRTLSNLRWVAIYHNLKVNELLKNEKSRYRIETSPLLPKSIKNPIRKSHKTTFSS